MDYIQFNLLEGVFWIVLGVVLLFLFKKLPPHFKRLTLFSATTVILFGISDFAEVMFGSFFEPGMSWLLVWKGVCVAGLITAIVWYVRIRTSR